MKTLLLHILLLTSSATLDARSTNRLFERCRRFDIVCTELNPVMRQFAGRTVMYVASPAADLTIYTLLRATGHRRAAAAYVYAEAGAHAVCIASNLHQARKIDQWAKRF
jgi:hypothetical protein